MAAPDSPKRRIAAKKPAAASSEARDSIWHRVGRYALYATVAALPWLVLPGTGTAADAAKTAFVALAATVGLIALLADTIERRRLTYPGSLVGLGVLGVVVTTALSALVSSSFSLSMFGGLVLADSLAHVTIAALLFVLAAVFVTDRFEAEKLMAAFLWGAGIAMAVSILSLLGVPYFSAVQVTGSLSGLGFLVVLAMGIATVAPWEELNQHGRILVAKTAVLGIATLVLINYAELWIALALVALLTASLAFMRKTSIRLPLAFAVIALALTLVGPFLPAIGIPRGEVRPNLAASMQPIKSTLSSSDAVLGTGPATYGYAFAKSHGSDFNATPFWDLRFDQAMSFVTTVPVTGGILGLIAWLFLGLVSLNLARTRLANPITMAASVGVALTTLMLLIFPVSFAQLALGAICLGVLVGWSGYRRTLPFSGPPSWRLLATFAAIVIVAAGSLAGTYVVGQKFAAAIYGGAAGRAAAAGDIDLSIQRLAHATSLDGSDINYRALSQVYLAKFQQLSADSEQEAGQQLQSALTLAIQAAQAAVQVNPADASNYGNLGAIYEGMTSISEGADQQAVEAYKLAAERDPSSPLWKLSEARVYGALADFRKRSNQPVGDSYEKAQAALRQALELKDDYVEARFVSARYYLAEGRLPEADAQTKRILGDAPTDAGLAFQVGLLYYQAEQLDLAQAALARAIYISPDFANARYFAGLAFARQGQPEQALIQFRAIAESNPDSEEIKKVIANLEAGRPVLDGISETPAPAASSTDAVVPAGDLPQPQQ